MERVYISRYYHGWSAKSGVTDYYVTLVKGISKDHVISYGPEDSHPIWTPDGCTKDVTRVLDTYIRQELSHPVDSYSLLFAKPIAMPKSQLQQILTIFSQGVEGRHVQKIHVIDAPVLTLYSLGCQTGVVVSLGLMYGSVSLVWEGVVIAARVIFKNKFTTQPKQWGTPDHLLSDNHFESETEQYFVANETAIILNSIEDIQTRATLANLVVLTGGASYGVEEKFIRTMADLVPNANVHIPEDRLQDVALGGKNYGALLKVAEHFWMPVNSQFPFAHTNIQKLWSHLFWV